MRALLHGDIPFDHILKSAAGFAFAAMALVGLVAAISGTVPADSLQYASALAGAIAGVLIAAARSRD